ncbi:hypothetical protein NONI108955_20520 [Nocardia ninae]|uniref:Uncharacterized protein n=1 Tax=Nocardia ninae NBRC 108245 TaxID=1210091 RepID=A0A511MCI9_9NOCA|nr:hypothetical protein [Nocardia ninae]GEM38350.1 hypothetical protein NN4_28690 [Nocardia ninae NBRC 108245]
MGTPSGLTVLVGIPGAAVALISLWSVVPLTRSRIHLHRVKDLAAVISATGAECPKVLRESLVRESYWVAAYRSVRYTRQDRSAVKWLLLGAMLSSMGMIVGVVTIGERYPWLGLPFLLGAYVPPFFFLPQAFALYRWVEVRRELYACLGGRADIPAIPRPSLLPLMMQAPTDDDVKRWFDLTFGGAPPLNPKKIQTNDMLLLKAHVADWLAHDRARWPDRIASEPRERAEGKGRKWPI